MRVDVVQDVWHSCGLFYQLQGRLHEALAVYLQWYEQYLAYQAAMKERIHKGGALVRISECHTSLGHPLLARRYLMLTTCEDALLPSRHDTSRDDRRVFPDGLASRDGT